MMGSKIAQVAEGAEDAGSLINGDEPLNASKRREYLRYHHSRNETNTSSSSRERAVTLPPPRRIGVTASSGCTPARVGMREFFEWAARDIHGVLGGRPVTIVDIGCGTGWTLEPFAALGFRGTYIGLDVAMHRKWKDGPVGEFERRLMIADVHRVEPALLPRIDILVSATALEHVRNDIGVIARLSSRLAPWGAQVHYVPGEASLALYGPHGWRQYSPGCLRRIFPSGKIHRYGGAASNLLHEWAITWPLKRSKRLHSERWPGVYSRLRSVAMGIDRLTGNRPPAMYGVYCAPDAGAVEVGVRAAS